MSRYTTSITAKIRWTSLSGSTARISRCEGQKEVLKLVERKHVFGRVGIALHLPLQFVMFSIIYIMLLLKTQEIPKLRQIFSFALVLQLYVLLFWFILTEKVKFPHTVETSR